MTRMVDKIVVVTGAALGIGAAIAQKFAEESATLVLLDFDAARLEQTADQLPGVKPLSIVADVTDEAAVSDAFARITDQYGRIDVLINNVGGARNMKLWEMTADAWDHTIRLNLRSAFLCTRAASRVMMRQRSGARVPRGPRIIPEVPLIQPRRLVSTALSATPPWSSPNTAFALTPSLLGLSRPSAPPRCSRKCAIPLSTARIYWCRCGGSGSLGKSPMRCFTWRRMKQVTSPGPR